MKFEPPYDYTNYTAISGLWINEQSLADENDVLYNPKMVTPPEYSKEVDIHASMLKVPSFTDLGFASYADGLKDAGTQIRKINPDLILVPLRGAARPWCHIRIFCDIPAKAGCIFPFTDKEKNSDETKALILSRLIELDGKDEINLVCIDGAEGGYGSKALLNILLDLHRNQGRVQKWKITLFLFVPKEKEKASWQWQHEQIGPHKNFIVTVKLIPVVDVIGEDVDGAMIDIRNFDKFQKVKFEEGMDTYLIETSELPAVIDEKITHSLHDALQTEPGLIGRSIIDIRIDSTNGAETETGEG